MSIDASSTGRISTQSFTSETTFTNSAKASTGAGVEIDRVPKPPREAVTLADYRLRYATYRSDPDLQEAHRQFPFVLVWDDHEHHQPMRGRAEGSITIPSVARATGPRARQQRTRAYLEWMPIRESQEPGIHLYRTFRYGTLVDLVMIDTRGLRDRQVAGGNVAALADPKRTLMGAAQEAWMFDQVRASQRANTPWMLLGQQVLFSRVTLPGASVANTDAWDGYQAQRESRARFHRAREVRSLVILTVTRTARGLRRAAHSVNGSVAPPRGVLAVELVAPAISSPPPTMFTPGNGQTWPRRCGWRSPI